MMMEETALPQKGNWLHPSPFHSWPDIKTLSKKKDFPVRKNEKMGGPSYGIHIIPLVVFLASHSRINPKRIKEPKEKRPKVCVFDLIFFSFLFFFRSCFITTAVAESWRRRSGSLTMSISSLLPYSRVAGFLFWKPPLRVWMHTRSWAGLGSGSYTTALFRLDRMRVGRVRSVCWCIYILSIYFCSRRTDERKERYIYV